MPAGGAANVQDGSLVTHRSVTPEQYGRFLVDVFEEWARHDIGTVYVQMFDTTLANWVGDLLGNIADRHMLELVVLPQQQKFGQDKRDTLTQYCLDCDVRFACNGGCPKDRFATSPTGEPGQHFLCPGYKILHKAAFLRQLVVAQQQEEADTDDRNEEHCQEPGHRRCGQPVTGDDDQRGHPDREVDQDQDHARADDRLDGAHSDPSISHSLSMRTSFAGIGPPSFGLACSGASSARGENMCVHPGG